jgi:hypothetical protein
VCSVTPVNTDIKPSLAVSRVSFESKTNVSETCSVSIIRAMTLVFDSTLTRLIAREGFITFKRRESFKSYISSKQNLKDIKKTTQ